MSQNLKLFCYRGALNIPQSSLNNYISIKFGFYKKINGYISNLLLKTPVLTGNQFNTETLVVRF